MRAAKHHSMGQPQISKMIRINKKAYGAAPCPSQFKKPSDRISESFIYLVSEAGIESATNSGGFRLRLDRHAGSAAMDLKSE